MSDTYEDLSTDFGQQRRKFPIRNKKYIAKYGFQGNQRKL